MFLRRTGHFFPLVAIILSLTGCASGKYYIERTVARQVSPPQSIQVQLNPDVHYMWVPEWGIEPKDRLVLWLEATLSRRGFAIVKNNADLVLLIERIDTGGWTGEIEITRVEIVGLSKGEQLFKVHYEQPPPGFDWRQLLASPKNPKQIGRLLGAKIAQELRGK